MTALRTLSIAAGATFLASCATAPRSIDTPGDASDDISGLETSITLDPIRFTASRGTTIELTLVNATDRDMRLRFPDDRQIALLVLDAGGELLYVDDETAALPTYLPLGVFESWDYAIDWDGRIEFGQRRVALEPGRYQLQVGLRRSGVLYVNRTDPVDFEVVESAD